MGGPPPATAQAKIDEEYMSLMAELGEGPAVDGAQAGRFVQQEIIYIIL